MEQKRKPAQKAPGAKAVKSVDMKKEIADKDLDKVSGGTQVQRDQIRYRRPK